MTQKTALARSANTPAAADTAKRSRDPVKTRHRILKTAMTEFCQHGFSGARVERIAAKSNSKMRMIYHYFSSKEGLYLAVLEAAYVKIRTQESLLDLSDAAPIEGMQKLIHFTFDFFAANPDVLALINSENTLRARYLRKIPNVKAMTVPLIDAISLMLKQGHRAGAFRRGVDPVQFYVSLVALSQLHILNRHTLSVIFDKDLSTPDWLDERRQHVEAVLMGYLQAK